VQHIGEAVIMQKIVRVAFIISIVMLTSCSSGNKTIGEEGQNTCKDVPKISIGDGLNPMIDWDPPCGVHWILVEDSTGDDIWDVGALALNCIKPPVRFGSKPRCSWLDSNEPLQVGNSYRIGLFRVENGDTANWEDYLWGYAIFDR